jgi:hypothetical protein
VQPGDTPRLPSQLLPGRQASADMAPLRLLWAALACASTGCSTRPPGAPVGLSIARVADECRFEAEGRSMSLEALTAAGKAWRRRGVHLDANLDTPYKCLAPQSSRCSARA